MWADSAGWHTGLDLPVDQVEIPAHQDAPDQERQLFVNVSDDGEIGGKPSISSGEKNRIQGDNDICENVQQHVLVPLFSRLLIMNVL